jgi:pseudouridine-5'-phosphate glycosidase
MLQVNEVVAAALASGRAVVALESTIIAHGMPFPQNLDMACDVERIIRAHGAVPATIAILDGILCVGLAPAQL